MIYQLGAPILRHLAVPVSDPTSASIATIAQHMGQVVQEVGGMGLAAPQLGYSLQMLVINSHPNHRYPHAPWLPPMVLINPQLLAHDSEIVADWEGCLSVPDQRAQVPRYRQVAVSYLDLGGREHHAIFTDFVARIFQHEWDHLQGKLFIDHVAQGAIISEAEYQRRINLPLTPHPPQEPLASSPTSP